MKYTIIKTDTFDEWLNGLPDWRARVAIGARLDRVADGNLGDYKKFDGFIELRIFHGPGYRVYGAIRKKYILLVLLGGDKGSQKRDIARAKKMLDEEITQEENDESNTI